MSNAQGGRPGWEPVWPELAGEGVGPVYGLFGEEDFLLAQALEDFLRSPAFAQNPSLNVERYHAGDTSPARVLESARTLPFLGTRRLVILQDLHQYKADQLNEFLSYLEDPVPSTCLVFSGEKLDTRTKFGKALTATKKLTTFKRLYANQVPGWLSSRAAVRGKRLAPEAARLLAEMASLGLGSLDQEVEKLSLFVGNRPEIGAGDVRQLTASGRLYSIFDFTDALAAGDLFRALFSHSQLDALGEPPVKILVMVERLWKQLLEVRRVLDKGGGEGEAQRLLHTPPQATRTLAARAARESAASLGRGLGRILEADRALKSSAGSDRVIMESLVMDLCAGGPDRPPRRAGMRDGRASSRSAH